MSVTACQGAHTSPSPSRPDIISAGPVKFKEQSGPAIPEVVGPKAVTCRPQVKTLDIAILLPFLVSQPTPTR